MARLRRATSGGRKPGAPGGPGREGSIIRNAGQIWPRLTIAAAALWLAASTYEVLGLDTSLAGKINLAASAILVAAAILGLGFGAQWAVITLREARQR